MWLSTENNKLKNVQCKKCRRSGERPPFFGIAWWFEGDASYTEELGCIGCGWAFPEEWRRRVHSALKATGSGEGPSETPVGE